MPTLSSSGMRTAPYGNFKFRIKFGNDFVAGISKVSALKRTVEMYANRSGGDKSYEGKMPGLVKFEALTLERGITHDVAFEQWANKVWNYNNEFGEESSNKDYKRDITLEIYNEAGQPVLRYFIFNAWVSEFQQTPELDANANAVAIEMIKVEHEGFTRDYTLQPPEEITFIEPAA